VQGSQWPGISRELSLVSIFSTSPGCSFFCLFAPFSFCRARGVKREQIVSSYRAACVLLNINLRYATSYPYPLYSYSPPFATHQCTPCPLLRHFLLLCLFFLAPPRCLRAIVIFENSSLGVFHVSQKSRGHFQPCGVLLLPPRPVVDLPTSPPL